MSGNGTTLNSRKLTLSLLPPAESPAAAEEVAAAADPVAVADAEEDMFFGGSRRVVTSGLQSKLIQPQARRTPSLQLCQDNEIT